MSDHERAEELTEEDRKLPIIQAWIDCVERACPGPDDRVLSAEDVARAVNLYLREVRDTLRSRDAALAAAREEVERSRRVVCAAEVLFGNRHDVGGETVTMWSADEELWEDLRRAIDARGEGCIHQGENERLESESAALAARVAGLEGSLGAVADRCERWFTPNADLGAQYANGRLGAFRDAAVWIRAALRPAGERDDSVAAMLEKHGLAMPADELQRDRIDREMGTHLAVDSAGERDGEGA